MIGAFQSVAEGTERKHTGICGLTPLDISAKEKSLYKIRKGEKTPKNRNHGAEMHLKSAKGN